jgi:hypothetical protein
MFEPYQEIAQLEKNLVEINRLVSRQTARIESLADKGGDTTKAKAVLRGVGRGPRILPRSAKNDPRHS